jgi:hypothetical protein
MGNPFFNAPQERLRLYSSVRTIRRKRLITWLRISKIKNDNPKNMNNLGIHKGVSVTTEDSFQRKLWDRTRRANIQ